MSEMTQSVSPLIPILIGSLLATSCLIGAFFNLRRKRTIDDLPTSKTQGVFIGLVELKGTAESETPLISYLGSTRCVQYSWQVEEHWSRTVHETYTDSKGHIQSRTRTENGWNRVASGGETIPFYLKDETGVIRILPEGAKIQANQTFNETCNPTNPLYYAKGPANSIANTTHQRRFHETALPLHVMLYTMGQARERQDVVAPEIARDKNAEVFLISTRSEKQISRGYGIWYWVLIVSGFLFSFGGGWAWLALSSLNSGLAWQPQVIMTGGYLLVLLLVWLWAAYNGLINLRNRVEQGWSQVDVQLKRRNDLIPNLVTTIEGYRGHESETQTALAELRTQITATPPGVSGPDFKGLAPLLRIVVERYPELKANMAFLKLEQTLVDTEQRIALARGYFNDTATFYNTRLEIVPDRFVAAIAGLRQRTLMSATDFERSPVQVKLVE
jgi:hypothetical protein